MSEQQPAIGAIPCKFNVATTTFKVADRFEMNCPTPEGITWKEKIWLEWPDEKQKYGIKILKTKSSTPSETVFEVAAYKPEKYDNVSLTLTDGISKVPVQAMTFEVLSVRTQEDIAPFESFGPLKVGYPLWFWVTIVLTVLLIAGGSMLILVRNARRRRLLDSLEQYNTMLSPFNQFSKDMRQIFKRLQTTHNRDEAQKVFQKIDEDFRLYLTRELRVPAMLFNNAQILKELKKYHRDIFKDLEPQFRKLLVELEKAKGDQQRIQPKDNEQLYYLARGIGEKIYERVRKKS